MNEAELQELQEDQSALAQATNLLARFPGEDPSPVTEADMENIFTALKNSRSALADSALVTAINTANNTWYQAIKTALETSQTDRQNDIDTLQGTNVDA
ncbi:MAG TPA: hypothetical protein VEB40_16810 [Flavipsychrobacter sp.]|nr:hypothetical protein [Flavipsychrobacter sp.]